MMVFPTIDLPPTSFGTRDNPYSNMLADSVTSNPVSSTIIMGYFTRAGEKLKWTGDCDKVKTIKVDSSFR